MSESSYCVCAMYSELESTKKKEEKLKSVEKSAEQGINKNLKSGNKSLFCRHSFFFLRIVIV